MKAKDFIDRFSHNNEVWIENRENYCMYHKYHPKDNKLHDGTVMDWSLRFTDIANCNVIRIANVIHERCAAAITIVVNTDKREFTYLPELTTLDNTPLWLYNRTHQTEIIGRETCD